jgi:YVTN family beta-propeller protein
MTDTRRREIWFSNMVESKVHIFDLDTLEYKLSLGTGGYYPKVIVQNPAGTLTVVSNWVSRDISVFDSDTKKLLRRIPVGGTPRGMAFSPDGGLLFTAIYDGPIVAVVDMKENKVSKRYRTSSNAEGAVRHVIYRDDKLYVSDMHWGTVNILNASTGAVIASKRIGSNINTIVLSPDGKRIFASSRGRNNPEDYTRPGPEFGAVYMLNAADLTVEERVWGRNQPTGLAVSPDGKYLAFTDFLDANLELYAIK